MSEPTGLCEICDEPMPPGEDVFRCHGYSGNCPKPPKRSGTDIVDSYRGRLHEIDRQICELSLQRMALLDGMCAELNQQ